MTHVERKGKKVGHLDDFGGYVEDGELKFRTPAGKMKFQAATGRAIDVNAPNLIVSTDPPCPKCNKHPNWCKCGSNERAVR